MPQSVEINHHRTSAPQQEQQSYGRIRISSPPVASRPVPSSPPRFTTFQGRTFIPPSSPFAHAIIMGNEASSLDAGRVDEDSNVRQDDQQRPASNLTVLLNQHNQQQQQQQQLVETHQPNTIGESPEPPPRHGGSPSQYRKSQSTDEADTASGPPPDQDASSMSARFLGSSAPSHLSASQRRTITSVSSLRERRPVPSAAANASTTPNPSYAFLVPVGMQISATLRQTKQSPDETVASRLSAHSNDRVRR
jgi:hypothetical protein